MKKNLSFAFLLSVIFSSGCGGPVEEVAPLTAPGTDPPAEQQKDWKAESQKRSGIPQE
jgi:hypothetical protein